VVTREYHSFTLHATSVEERGGAYQKSLFRVVAMPKHLVSPENNG
jgi:hypothetical protein